MSWFAYVASAGATVATLAVAGAGTRPTTDWYVGLTKPTWQPDPSLIGLAWTILYPLIAIVGAYVWNNTDGTRRWWWLAVFGTNLVLNAAWSWVFFVAQEPAWAAIEMGLLLTSTVALAVLAWQAAPWAGAAMVAYAAWVSFAGWLTVTIARLNA
jgi:tryptophan-rich sensory protein